VIGKCLPKKALIVLIFAFLLLQINCGFLTESSNDCIKIKKTIDLTKSDVKFSIVGSLEFGVFEKVPIVIDEFNNICLLNDIKINKDSEVSLVKIFHIDGALLDIFAPLTFYQQDEGFDHIIWTITRNLDKNYLSRYYLSVLGFCKYKIKKVFSIETPASKVALYTEFHDSKGGFDSVLFCQSANDENIYQYDSKNILCNSYVYQPSKLVCFAKRNLPVIAVCSKKSMQFMKPLQTSRSKLEIEKSFALDYGDIYKKQVINARDTDPIIINNLYNICFYNGTYTYVYNIDRDYIERQNFELIAASTSGCTIETAIGIFDVEKGYYRNSIDIKPLFEEPSSDESYSLLQIYNDYYTGNLVIKVGVFDGHNSQLRIQLMSSDGSQKRLLKVDEQLKGRVLFSYYNLIITDDCLYVLEDLSFISRIDFSSFINEH
jgi:hypothetical protein